MHRERRCGSQKDQVPLGARHRCDPTYNTYTELQQLPQHITAEIANFFEIYKMLEHKTTATNDVLDASGAKEIIRKSMDSYDVHYCGKYED